jgi:thiosulfate/3-mercaptopyruvate sulfurtransferase
VDPVDPWKKVYIELSEGTANTVGGLDMHMANLSCVDCHKGDPKQPNNKELAHKGFIKDPSDFIKDANGNLVNSCMGSGCHDNIANNYQHSLHQNLYGEKRMVALRSSVSTFEECPSSTVEGFNHECASCHATCGDCHISVPNSAGQGFLDDHRFKKTPDETNNCMACHGSRVSFDYLPNAEEGTHGDVHKEKGMDCLSCHSKKEMHSAVGDKENTHRYNYSELPSCEDCHSGLSSANKYHEKHMDDMTCFVCHSSKKYNNCTDCHVNHQWKTDDYYQANNPAEDFRIGINPLTEHSEAKFALLRHIPIAPNSYSYWGEGSADLPAYDSHPSWKYTSPHNIQKITFMTDTTGEKKCYDNCHTKDGFGNSENKQYYLFKNYIQTNWPDEVNANRGVVVDGKLPSGWE